MDNQARTRTKSNKPPARPELEPISYEEIMANAGMSGFVSFLDVPESEPVASKPSDAPALPGVSVFNTVSEPDTVKETNTVQQRKSDTVQEPSTAEQIYTVPVQSFQDNRRWRVKRT